MRDIIFRGKRVDNGEWVEGYYYKTREGNTRIHSPHTVFKQHFTVLPETVGQYTGKSLTSNSTNKEEKLFDGDVIGWAEDYDDKFGHPVTAYGKGVIVWNKANCCFGVKTSGTNIQDFNDFDFDDSCMIIGNLHDNPELLEV